MLDNKRKKPDQRVSVPETAEGRLEALEGEVLQLVSLIDKMKEEVAAIKHPSQDSGMLGSLSEQMEEIAKETGGAADTILAAAEEISEVAETMKAEIRYKGASPHFEKILNNTNNILEACSFHDITSQRITRMSRIINAVEETLGTVVLLIGEDALAALPVKEREVDKVDSGIKLEGPAIGGPAMSQDDIDSLFD